MSWGEKYRIETPEQIDFDLEIAGPGSRFYAQFLDWVIKWVIIAGIALFVLLATVLLGTSQSLSQGVGLFLLALAVAAVVIFFFGYDIYFEGCRNGQTPGKGWAGIRVVRDSGGPIDVRAAVIRNIVGLADFLPGFYLGGGLISLLNQRGQRLGDMAAGTVVVRERATELRDQLEDDILEIAGNEFAFTPEHLSRCAANDQHVLQSYFARARDLEPSRRRDLADKLRDTMLERTGYEVEGPIYGSDRTDAFLASLYRDLKAARRQR